MKKVVGISKAQKKKPKEVISKNVVPYSLTHIRIVGNRLDDGSKEGSKGVEDVKVHPPKSPPKCDGTSEKYSVLMEVSPMMIDGVMGCLDKLH